jgi:L-asparagine transporter-like permease
LKKRRINNSRPALSSITIGTGIFVLSGLAAAKNAGPAVTLSFTVAAVAAGMLIL